MALFIKEEKKYQDALSLDIRSLYYKLNYVIPNRDLEVLEYTDNISEWVFNSITYAMYPSRIKEMGDGCGYDSEALRKEINRILEAEYEGGMLSTSEMTDLIMNGLNGNESEQKKIWSKAITREAQKRKGEKHSDNTGHKSNNGAVTFKVEFNEPSIRTNIKPETKSNTKPVAESASRTVVRPEKKKKPFFKKWWFWPLLLLLLYAIFSPSNDKTEPSAGGEQISVTPNAIETNDESSETKSEEKDMIGNKNSSDSDTINDNDGEEKSNNDDAVIVIGDDDVIEIIP